MAAIGIDVGGTTIKVCLVAPDGRRLGEHRVPTPRGVTELVAEVAEQVTRVRREHPGSHGVGVVVPGVVDEATGTAVHSVNLGWRDVPMRDLLCVALGEPVAFGHDVRAGALAEARWGAGAPDMLYVPVGTGIAAAVVLGGRTVGGPLTGEIGQLLVPDDGALVPLEQVASAAAVARRFGRRTGTEVAGAAAVAERARAGDPRAREVIEGAMTVLGDALATSVALLGPVRIVVGGGLAGAGELVLAPLRAALARRLTLTPVPEVVVATLGSWSQALGAAALVEASS